jgi:hypothetical protein
MTTLNTQDFIDSYKALHTAKYSTLPAHEYLVLNTILTVSIEWGKTLDEVQELLNKKTKEQNLELQFFQDAKAGK